LFAEQPLCLQKFVAGILRAAETNLALVPVGKKKSYISNSTSHGPKLKEEINLGEAGLPRER
jgi:hypothetical protein